MKGGKALLKKTILNSELIPNPTFKHLLTNRNAYSM